MIPLKSKFVNIQQRLFTKNIYQQSRPQDAEQRSQDNEAFMLRLMSEREHPQKQTGRSAAGGKTEQGTLRYAAPFSFCRYFIRQGKKEERHRQKHDPCKHEFKQQNRPPAFIK